MLPLKLPLHTDAGIQALACVDLSSGVVLDSSATDELTMDALETAAAAAGQVAVAPRADSADDGIDAREALIVSDRGIHALARSCRYPDRVIVAVAPPGANVALVLATVRSLADALSD